VDVDSITEPLRQIVPTLLDVPYSADELAPLASSTSMEDVDNRLTTASQQVLESSELETDSEQTLPLDTNVESVTAESVDVQKHFVTHPVEPKHQVELASEVLSVPDLTVEADAGDTEADPLESRDEAAYLD